MHRNKLIKHLRAAPKSYALMSGSVSKSYCPTNAGYRHCPRRCEDELLAENAASRAALNFAHICCARGTHINSVEQTIRFKSNAFLMAPHIYWALSVYGHYLNRGNDLYLKIQFIKYTPITHFITIDRADATT